MLNKTMSVNATSSRALRDQSSHLYWFSATSRAGFLIQQRSF